MNISALLACLFFYSALYLFYFFFAKQQNPLLILAAIILMVLTVFIIPYPHEPSPSRFRLDLEIWRVFLLALDYLVAFIYFAHQLADCTDVS